MLELGNGRIYLNKDEPLPHSCPRCLHPVAYTQKSAVTCSACGHNGPRETFSTSWTFQEPN